MNLTTRFLTILAFSGWIGSANAVPAKVLIEVDIADLSAVTFSSTGAAASVDGSAQNTFSGVSLLRIFSADESAIPDPTGTLMANGTTESYSNTASLPAARDLNFWVSLGSLETQDFNTTDLAFSGVAVLDLTGYSILTAGSMGDILDDDNLQEGVIIGQWAIIDLGTVPAPATLALFGIGLLALRRRGAFKAA